MVPSAAESAMEDSIHFQFAVYLLRSARINSVDESKLIQASLKRFPDLIVVDEIPGAPSRMVVHSHIQKNVKREYAPPDLKSLRYSGHGISQAQAQALQNSREAIILDFAHPKNRVWIALRAASELVEEIARQTSGLVWDEQTREVFSPDAWHQERLASWTNAIPDLSKQTVIHTYNESESVRAITLGMSKMGLPDIVVEGGGWSSSGQVANFISLFYQAIAEGASLNKSGEFKLVLRAINNPQVRDSQLKSLKANAIGTACVTLKQAKSKDGDPENRLIRLAADKYPGNDESARQEAMISSFFGWEDSVSQIQHNEELLAASARAREKLPELQKAFSFGLEPGEFIDVKAPFDTRDGGREWMWVEVTSWRGDKIEGFLDNEPVNVRSLHSGQKVHVRQEDVFDYIRRFADRHSEGNSTSEIIGKMDQDRANEGSRAKPLMPMCESE